MAKRGRPTRYTRKIADEICRRIMSGESLNKICSEERIPEKSTVLLWAADDREGFSDQYAKACLIRAMLWAEEVVDISDNGSNDWMEQNGEDNMGYRVNGEHIARSRLRVDTRKWIIQKMLPKFAEKQEVAESDAIASMLKTIADKLPG